MDNQNQNRPYQYYTPPSSPPPHPGSSPPRQPTIPMSPPQPGGYDDDEEEEGQQRRYHRQLAPPGHQGGYGDGDDEDDELDAAEMAVAAAEAAAMSRDDHDGGAGLATGAQGEATNRRNAANGVALGGDQALMGAAENELVGNFEARDENAELVQQAFLQFLQEYQQEVRDVTNPEDYNDDDADGAMDGQVRYVCPYRDQAEAMAQKLLRQANMQSSPGDDEDDDNDGRGNPASTAFSTTLLVNFRHILQTDPELADAIQGEYCRFEPFLRRAVQLFVLDLVPSLHNNNNINNKPSFFCSFFNLPTTVSIRQLQTSVIGALSSMTGTVTRTSEVRPELLQGTFRCNKCGLLAGPIPQQYHYTRPTLCKNPRCKNQSPIQFTLEIRESEFCDWQKLRVQEHSNQIPAGSMPRSMDVILRHEMVESCKAGDKCVFVGSLVVIPDGHALAKTGEVPKLSSRSNSRSRPSDAATGGGGGISGLKALGVRQLTYRTCFVVSSVLSAESLSMHQDLVNSNKEHLLTSMLFGRSSSNRSSGGNAAGGGNGRDDFNSDDPTSEQVVQSFTTAQRAEIRAMQQSPRLYEQMVASIAPNTFGHSEIKKGILLLLLGGVHKTTAGDHIKLRGDINACVIGDPSTAKSQFLKYVYDFLPNRAVYTSGKASSAAGLTAAVQRDQDTGEYCIEAGALMLADNGICCIDEFDKMDPKDQVAIHEAMEQQTISITKAGIQATLNARASILAAANPIYGRYDRTKTLKSNVNLSAPILSRFDLFFVVLDECNPEIDEQVARHILNVHRANAGGNGAGSVPTIRKPPFTKDQMRRYIRFARTLNPRLTPTSQRVLVECYRKLRQGDTLGRSRSAYRITVRQLESMIRLSEALARLYCADEIQPSYVREAYRLLKTSIIQVETADVQVEDDDDDDDDDDVEDDDNGGGDDDDDNQGGDDEAMPNSEPSRLESQPPQSHQQQQRRNQHGNDDDDDNNGNDDADDDRWETQPPPAVAPGEYGGENSDERRPRSPTGQMDEDSVDNYERERQEEEHAHEENQETQQEKKQTKARKKAKKAKRKTKISYEEYETITNAIAGHLRAIEQDYEDRQQSSENNDSTTTSRQYLTWDEVAEWYLETHCEEDIIGDSIELLQEWRKKLNLVIKRLIDVDRILVIVGGGGGDDENDANDDGRRSRKKKRKKSEEQGQIFLAVHPNYEVL